MASSIIISNDILLSEVDSLLEKGKEVIILAKGSSMLPFIRDSRDSVKLKRSDSLRTGDIVLAKLPSGNWVLHRIFSLNGENVTLMGDGNIRGKEYCKTCDIAGTVISIIDSDGKERKPSGGRLWKALLPARRYLLYIYKRIF